MSARRVTVPITMRALVQRLNRALAKEGRTLRAVRGESRGSVGDYIELDVERGTVRAANVDPEARARELGVLKTWERVERP